MIKDLSKKSEQRRDKIIQAALELFLNNGYENTSLSDIIALSGGSLSTIYKCFGDKDGLFKSVIEFMVSEFSEAVRKSADFREDVDLETFLSKFAQTYVRIVFSQKATLLKKLIFSETFNPNSQVTRIFNESGAKAVHKILIDFFERPQIRATLREQNLQLLAFRFCFLLEEPILYCKNVLSDDLLKTKAQKDKWIKNCVEFFLKGACK